MSITVLPNSAPTVSLTEPVAGGAYFAPATVRLAATASDSDGSIQRVEFYAGGTLLGTASAEPYSLVWDAVAIGTYVVTAVAVDDRGGATTSSPVTVMVAGPSLAILEPAVDPADGFASGMGSVYVRGTVNAPPNSAVSVNGRLAVIDDAGQFHVNNVPLGEGVTTLTAILITQDGVSVSASRDVTNAGGAEFTVEPDGSWGLQEKDIIFTTVIAPAAVPIDRVEYDFNGDGVIDFTAHPADFTGGELRLALTYPQPGRYLGRVTAFDEQNQPLLTARHAIVMKNPAVLGTTLQGIFTQMLERLRAANLDGALRAIQASAQDNFQQVFTALLTQPPEAIDGLGAIVDGQLTEDYAELVLARDEASGSFAHYIYFTRGEDGIWRIDAM